MIVATEKSSKRYFVVCICCLVDFLFLQGTGVIQSIYAYSSTSVMIGPVSLPSCSSVVIETEGISTNTNAKQYETNITNLRGFNYRDQVLTTSHSRNFTGPTDNDRLVSDFHRFKHSGYNVIRIPIAWEAFEKNPIEFRKQLERIADVADETRIMVIYDVHQWGTSSYLFDWGMGFPRNMMMGYIEGGGETQQIRFWNDFFNNTIIVNGKTSWQLLSEFIITDIVAVVDSHPSTLGYEIINEPELYDKSQYKKLGDLHTYVGQQIRNSGTTKYIFFDMDHPHGFNRDHMLDRLINPRGISNTVFSPHVYSILRSDAASGSSTWQFSKWKENAAKWGVPIFVGEWAVFGRDGINLNVQAFACQGVGWSYWNYAPPQYVNRLDYMVINDDYSATAYWDYLKGAITAHG